MSYDPRQSRASKVFTSLEGMDEFSVNSVEPDPSVLRVELEAHRVASQGRPELPSDDGIFMRLFRKMFRG